MFYDAKKWIPLLIIPALRIVTAPFMGDSYAVAANLILASIRDSGIAVLLLFYSVLKWRRCRYHLREYAGGSLHSLTLSQGVVLRRVLRVSAEDAASVEMERTPLLWLLGGRRLRINTAGLRRKSDAILYLSAAQAKNMMGNGISRKGANRYAARLWPVLVMSASSSNAALGLLALAPALRQAGRLLGEELPGEVVGLFRRFVSIGLPPIFESVANVLVLGWAFAFLRSLLRYAGFRAERQGNRLHLVSGLFTRRDVLIDCDKITALELRQTLFMRLFGLYTAVITAAGYGRDSGARPVLIPAARPKELCAALDGLLPDYPICTSTLRPKKTALFGYLAPAVWLLTGSLLPLWLGGVWKVAAALWAAGATWWLLVRFLGFYQAGFGVGRGAAAICYSRGLALYRVYIPLEVTDCAIIRRSPWQQNSDGCTVELRCFGEKRRRHRVRHLPYRQALGLVHKLQVS